MGSKKGSITVIFIILLSISNLLIRINRLVVSHTFLEKGIYSIDEREFEYDMLIENIEENLNFTYDDEEKFDKLCEKYSTIESSTYKIEILKKKVVTDPYVIIKISKFNYVVEARGYYDKSLQKIVLERKREWVIYI